MQGKLILLLTLLCTFDVVYAQRNLHLKDSTTVSLITKYDKVSIIHRKLFGENYRKEWAAQTKLPVIKISEILGGLKPTELGGGHQSHSLRLEEKSGKEWVLRSVRKYSEGLAPDVIKGSVYENLIDDNFSAQHPYSALIVPVLADAVDVPHTNPVIGWVAPDKMLGEFEKEFAGTICLLEEREPEGDSDNTPKMLAKLDEDNDNRFDSLAFFRARLLDLLIADWGRHEDQWRWADKKKGEGKNYLVVPRDRDQVLYVNEGLLPKAVASTSLLSFLEGFNADYKDPNAFFINGRKLNQQFLNSFSYEDWMKMTQEFVAAVPDNVLRKAVKRLPASSYGLHGELIFSKLQGRRDNMLEAMDTYYKFLYSIVDVFTSDKAELVELNEAGGGSISLKIVKLSKSGDNEQVLFANTFKPDITREIRIFLGKGDDVVRVNTPGSNIKLTIVGGEGKKNYDISQANTKINVYENLENDTFSDPNRRLIKHLSTDTLNIKKAFSNLYLGSGITPTADIRSIDGISLGLAYTTKKEGFRKEPYGSMQKISAVHSLSTKSFNIQYDAEWKELFKKTDLIVNAIADMKGNILNYFGRGNETIFNQATDFRTFYRVNFSYYKVEPSLRLTLSKNLTVSAGPSFQYFKMGDNTGRYINSADIATASPDVHQDKAHGGLFMNLNWNNSDHQLFPTRGLNFNLLVQGYEGLNRQSSNYAQVFPQITLYKSLDAKGKVVLANRIGGGFTRGTTTFYQSAFLGGQGNLLGFRKFRFAGDNMLYNNLEARITVPNFLHYILPGKIGLIGFYDVGRVWVKGENSNLIHHGVGAGIFLAPFNRFLIRVVAGYAEERWQPAVMLKQRF